MDTPPRESLMPRRRKRQSRHCPERSRAPLPPSASDIAHCGCGHRIQCSRLAGDASCSRDGMAASGWGRGCDILIFYSQDAEEWCQYLQDLFISCHQVRSQKMRTYRLGPDTSFSAQDLWVFRDARCMLVLLSAGLVECFCQPGLLPVLQRAFHPPQRVVRFLCGVQSEDEDFETFFPEWEHWQELTCDDEPETYLAAVRKVISEGAVYSAALGSVWGLVFHLSILLVRRGSKPRAVPGSHGAAVPGAQSLAVTYWHRPSEKSDPLREGEVAALALCGGIVDDLRSGHPHGTPTHTEFQFGSPATLYALEEQGCHVLYSIDSGCDSVTDTEPEDERALPLSKQTNLPLETSPGNLMVVQPDRIRCGAETTVYVIVRCKLDEKVSTEAEFSPEDSPSVRVEGTLENEYTVSVKAPDLSSGNVCLKVYSGDLVVCETTISYYTDMEEIGNLLSSAANPVEFMCQAFKIVPYNTETLDKLLTESLKNNIPASGLHLFGINQLEEEDMMTNQRDEELPTLLHFAAKYGLKNLTALLLTCPGALQAYSVANRHGHYPNTIAEKHGFRDLRQFIDEYVETVDMLKSHIKEELMHGEEADDVYESMAHLSTDLLMKCSLNPGCDEELYESMAAFAPAATEDLYVEMLQASAGNPGSRESLSRPTKDSMIRKFLEVIWKAPGKVFISSAVERDGCGQISNETVLPGALSRQVVRGVWAVEDQLFGYVPQLALGTERAVDEIRDAFLTDFIIRPRACPAVFSSAQA
ncbi:Phosphoinositide 3-kinase adapter protein 1 [Microtus ochrogaster]|uniref:Phosphoinositide 3-kinase adapter protein 1 n=1 Tax=Microtus ochrogaster TaxID=79684 RepID=A0A8J6KNW3_MICOH|nr:Phosphoinositide 3-kinase adapter protein 1 [Microtus ochrogaster]